MEKTGQVEVGVSRCDECGNTAVTVVGSKAYCARHKPGAYEKQAGVSTDPTHLKSFTEPLAVVES